MAPGCVSCSCPLPPRASPKSRILTRPFGCFEPDVGRLDVPVDQPAGVGGGQPLGDLPADAQHLLADEATGGLAAQPFIERL